jgi:starch synthase
MKVLHIASEIAPYSGDGPLGSVVGPLSRATAAAGVDVRAAMPLYQSIRTLCEVETRLGGRLVRGSLETDGPASDPDVVFVRNDHYFGRAQMYGYDDEAERFLFLSLAALEGARQLEFRPDIIHCHDWHTGLVPSLARLLPELNAFFKDAAYIFTVHHLAHQGCFGPWVLDLAGLPRDLLHYQALEFYGQVSFLKAGIVTADAVTTNSPSYAAEIQTEQHGENLHGVLAEQSERIFGVLTGIDTEAWDPATDPHIARRFTADTVADREGNARALAAECGFDPDGRGPIVAIASRLTTENGLGLITNAATMLLAKGVRLVVVGRGDPYYEKVLAGLECDNPGSVRCFPDGDPDLIRRVYAGSHLLLRPSVVERSATDHMVAMRYGCVPVVHPTASLRDTVTDADADPQGTGFALPQLTEDALGETVGRATRAYENTALFRGIQKRCMALDFSWGRAANEYLRIYEHALAQRRRGG